MANVWSASLVSTAINYLSLRDWFGSYDNAVFGGLLIIIISIAPEGPFKPLGLFVRRLIGKTCPRRESFPRKIPRRARRVPPMEKNMALLDVENVSRRFGGLGRMSGVTFVVKTAG